MTNAVIDFFRDPWNVLGGVGQLLFASRFIVQWIKSEMEGKSVIPVLQGRAVGGTTVVNGAIVWRLPEDAYDRAFRSIGAHSPWPGAVTLGLLALCAAAVLVALWTSARPGREPVSA